MNPFKDFITETVTIQRPDGSMSEPVKCSISDDLITVFDETLDLSAADKLIRALPNGKAQRYDVLDVDFNNDFHGIPAHFEIKVRRQGAVIPAPKSTVTNISISDSHGFQVGDHNIQSVVNSFKYVLKAIDDSNASTETKAEAKGRLKAFLEHPLTSALLGGAVGGLL